MARGIFSNVGLPKRSNSPMNKLSDARGKAKDKDPEKKTTTSAIAFLKERLAKLVNKGDLSPDDIIIAVVGPTGSGKSTFINIITGFETDVGHTLESCTNEINNVRFSLPGLAYGDLVYVDAPGFDNAQRSDAEVLKMVHNWLTSRYGNGILLSGLLYFHRISDNRKTGTPLRNLPMFEELCGKKAFQNVILTTTMWDDVDDETGKFREEDLKSNYWKSMLDRSSTTSRFMGTRESAFSVIDPLIEAANKRSSGLLQKELIDMGRKLPSTSPGQEAFLKMKDLVSQHEDLLFRIRKRMKGTDGDETTLESLQKEYQRLRIDLEATVNEMRGLKLPLASRLLKMTDKFFSAQFQP